ncbi:9268_t:CDS:2 [Cetraspora pellucida]|uniref:9268_t:CDS:1 n=1 Tax=Cetraspora pellucida TaxID=1433469 RepID=A0A9N9JXL2_9GLOM|nr:9268_t:CDS:2 [Cetraspora pellucida]
MAAPQYRCLTFEMRDDIELLAASSVHTGAIINVLTYKYPDQYIHAHSVYNIIQVEMPGWYIDAKFEGSDNHLVGLLWLHPKQIDNNYNRSQLVATALIIDEQKITFEWILQELLNATGC